MTVKSKGSERPPGGDEVEGTIRLHRYLAISGIASRRRCEETIRQGRVSVNGTVVTRMGVRIHPHRDLVRLDGERVHPQKKATFMLHKPAGVICTNADPMGRPRAVDLVPASGQRLYTAGRLDLDSSGLILLTNDGEIAQVVTHPRYGIEKVYRVTVRGLLDAADVARLRAGVWTSAGKTLASRLRVVDRDRHREETTLDVTLMEGRNREVRRLFAAMSLKVRRLVRTRLGPLTLGDLAVGRWSRLDPSTDLAFVWRARDGAQQEPGQRPAKVQSSRRPRSTRPRRQSAGRQSAGRQPAGRQSAGRKVARTSRPNRSTAPSHPSARPKERPHGKRARRRSP